MITTILVRAVQNVGSNGATTATGSGSGARAAEADGDSAVERAHTKATLASLYIGDTAEAYRMKLATNGIGSESLYAYHWRKIRYRQRTSYYHQTKIRQGRR